MRSVLYTLYFALPHLELFDVRDLVIHNYPLIDWSIWFCALLYGSAYAAVFLLAACLMFRRRALN